jgi:diguanylate cyclase (GGDEF)-like protein/putative nucleotidyltransferase with HDIG domain
MLDPFDRTTVRPRHDDPAAAPVALIRLARSRWLRVAFALGAITLAVAAAVGVIDSRHAAIGRARAGTAYPVLRATAAREQVLLRRAYAHLRSSAARARFFAAAERETTLIEEVGAGGRSSTASYLQARHTAALAAAARALGARAGARRGFVDALGLLADVEHGAADGILQVDLVGARSWPATTMQRVDAGGLGLVVLAGAITLLRNVRRALGLTRADGETEIERLTHAARSDTLTGLANRRAFQEDLSAAIEERNKKGDHFALLAFDLDGLKQINDQRGHASGDAYIRNVAECLRAEVGASGTVYRTGGDEFMALLPAQRGWHALTIANNIQRTAQRATGRRALSIGITESTKTEGRRLLLHQADLALYEAKRGKLVAVSYHRGLEPRTVVGDGDSPSQQQKALAAALARAVDAKDAGTRNHCETVAELSVAIGARVGITGARLERLRLAGLLHDVGKIGVPDAILGKRGSLAPDERSAIELHTSVGHAILTSAELHEEAVWVLHHHERYDGAGYPAGLGGEEIPKESRIIAVADAFEAMTGARPYRTALTPDEALRELLDNDGTQFDPECVRALDEVFGGRGEQSQSAAPTIAVAASA